MFDLREKSVFNNGLTGTKKGMTPNSNNLIAPEIFFSKISPNPNNIKEET